MKLVIFNGSPRKKTSNSSVLINQFLNGFHDNDTTPVDLHYLADNKKADEHLQAFKEASNILIIFPLYTDAMPGQVMSFIEKLETVNTAGKTIGFIVQSGFPEAYHSIFIERYLEKLSKRMKCNYLGTIIKGGVEGIKIMPPSMTKKLFGHFYNLGKHFAATGKFNPEIKDQLRHPYRMSVLRRAVMRILMATGLSNFYWNKKLKENHAFENRFAQPYV